MNMRYIVLAFVLFGSANSWAATTDVAFDSLPSAQGWGYQGQVPETSAFSVDGTTLTLNTLGQGDVTSIYFMANIIDPTLPFTILFRARVLQEDAPGSFPFVISIWTGQENFQASLGVDQIRAQGQVFALDGTQFHDFRFEAVPGVGSSFFVDGNLLSSFAPFPSPIANQILFGDGSASPNSNGLAEIQRLTIQTQTPLTAQIRALITQVEELLPQNHDRLVNKLEAAIARLNQGNTRAACNQLRKFIIQVKDFINIGILPPKEGKELIRAANEGCITAEW